jgi:hypothetical protein
VTLAFLSAAVLSVALLVVALPSTGPVYGVLEADPRYLASDYQAGIRLAIVQPQWDAWEPRPGAFDRRYRAQEIAAVQAYRSAGYEVGVDIGLQSPPAWLLQRPGAQLVDQFGNQSGTANFEFDQSVRVAAAAYIRVVVDSLGPVKYYRVGLSGSGEALYPEAPGDNWWAFDPRAQGAQGGLPPGVPAVPLPAWVPGDALYHGRSVTQVQVRSWYRWYFGASVNAHAWEIRAYRAAGYTGMLQLVMPGYGTGPSVYRARMRADLAPVTYDPFDTMNTGAVWFKFLAELPDLHGLVVDISSVGDGSGIPANNTCQPGDDSEPLDSVRARFWSDTRWLTYLAHSHGLQVMGENPGNTRPAQLPEILELARSCGLIALQWAWDYQLHSRTYASLRLLRREMEN